MAVVGVASDGTEITLAGDDGWQLKSRDAVLRVKGRR